VLNEAKHLAHASARLGPKPRLRTPVDTLTFTRVDIRARAK
jgi:hypothetical protein